MIVQDRLQQRTFAEGVNLPVLSPESNSLAVRISSSKLVCVTILIYASARHCCGQKSGISLHALTTTFRIPVKVPMQCSLKQNGWLISEL